MITLLRDSPLVSLRGPTDLNVFFSPPPELFCYRYSRRGVKKKITNQQLCHRY